ncbi:MAG TPA: dUTP diphosphatase [Phycisphaerales bacterium]|nr:dUTP diphosphatase [Phycisphaerales bacterium]
MSVEMRVKVLRAGAVVPSYQTEGAAGMDLSACPTDGAITIARGAIVLVPTGISIAVPRGHEGQVRPRSGLASRHGITLVNSPGTIDCDYRGEVMVPVVNHGKEDFVVEMGMRIAQLVIAPVVRAEVVPVEELDVTLRGAGGFGSTGVRARAGA